MIALFAIQNVSNPPRTLGADKTFEFVLPPGAQLDSGDAKGPGGQPIKARNRDRSEEYLRLRLPSEAGRDAVPDHIHLPYSGEARFSPKPLANVQHFVVMLPKRHEVSFTPKNARGVPEHAR